MGDCGSLFLGFFLGGVSLIDNQVAMRRNVISITPAGASTRIARSSSRGTCPG